MRLLAAFFSLSFIAAACTTTVATHPPDTAPAPSASATAPAPEPSASAAPTAAPTASASASASAPAPTCMGKVDSPPAGLEVSNEPVPSFAIGNPGDGKLCQGEVFVVKQPVKVYRVYTAAFETAKKAGPTGAYWSFTKPTGSLDAYRTTYEICAEWNDLDMLNECQVDVGAKIVLGPGQSAKCDSGVQYGQSAANQVLIVKGADGKVPVSNCKQTKVTWSK